MCISVRVCVCVCVCVDYMVLKESLPVKNSWTIYRFMVVCGWHSSDLMCHVLHFGII